jgi:GNAT superfamily N-acetyltransferase
MDKAELKEFTLYLKKKKYLGIIQNLKLEYNTDKKTPHIYLSLIQIKKIYRCQGYGSLVMQDIIDFANIHQLEIWLYATNIYGSDLERLYQFYMKLGFVLYNKKDGRFKYIPENILKPV